VSFFRWNSDAPGLKCRESAAPWRRRSHGAYAQAIVAIGMVFAGLLVDTAGRIFFFI
jgi:hypothetical protein